MKKMIGIIITFMILICVGLSGCNEQTATDNTNGNSNGNPGSTIDNDSDNDGYDDDIDEFPNNPYEWLDSDKDGVGDNSDDFPYDSTQWEDRDNDGYGDNPNGNNPDAFPDDSSEWRDSDGDGFGNNVDIYDNGNGAIKVIIDEFHCDKQAWDDLISGTPDPYFVIKITVKEKSIDEWVLVKESTSDVFWDSISLYNVFYAISDIDEDTTMVDIDVDVWDSDIPIDEVIDIGDDYSPFFYPQSESTKSYSYDGRLDLQDELDGWIDYTVSVVGQ